MVAIDGRGKPEGDVYCNIFVAALDERMRGSYPTGGNLEPVGSRGGARRRSQRVVMLTENKGRRGALKKEAKRKMGEEDRNATVLRHLHQSGQ